MHEHLPALAVKIAKVLSIKPEYVVTTSEFNDVKGRLLSLHNRRKPDAKDDNKPRLREQNAEAAACSIFGAPSFVTSDGELFWGNDRLEAALDWAKR